MVLRRVQSLSDIWAILWQGTLVVVQTPQRWTFLPDNHAMSIGVLSVCKSNRSEDRIIQRHLLISWVPSEVARGVQLFFWSTIENCWSTNLGLKPKASLRREAPKGGGWGVYTPSRRWGSGGLPREIFGKLPRNGALWCILEQLLQISKPKTYMKIFAYSKIK